MYLICTKLQINNIHFQLHYFAPVDFMTGVQTSLASNFEPNSNYLKTETIQDHQDILNLLRQMPKYLEEIQVLLEKGIESGLTMRHQCQGYHSNLKPY